MVFLSDILAFHVENIMYHLDNFEHIVANIETHDDWYQKECQKLEKERIRRNKENYAQLNAETDKISNYLTNSSIDVHERWDVFVTISQMYESSYGRGYEKLSCIYELEKNPLFEMLYDEIRNEIMQGDEVKFVDLCNFDGYLASRIPNSINNVQNREEIMEGILQIDALGFTFDW